MGIIARGGLVGAVFLAVAALTAPSAQAESGEVQYSCQWQVYVDGSDPGAILRGEGPASASFDTGVPDGLVVQVRQPVSLNPPTATVVLPDAFVQHLRDAAIPNIVANVWDMVFYAKEAGDRFHAFLPGKQIYPVPAEGTVPVEFAGEFRDGGWVVEDFQFRTKHVGVNTIVGTGFAIDLDPQDGGPTAYITCEPAGEDPVVDVFEATPAPKSTTVPSPEGSPVRPAVVQTDFAGDDGPRPSPFPGVAGLLAVSAVAVLAASRRGPTGSRRR